MKLARNVVTILILLLTTLSGTEAQELLFRKIDATNGLSSNHIRSIYSTSDGYLWIGTLNGLDRYDGFTFRRFTNMTDEPNSEPLSVVSWMREDYKGILWLFTRDNTIVFYDPQTEHFATDHEVFNKTIKIEPLSIVGMTLDSDQNLWLADKQNGIYKYDKRNDLITQIQQEGNSNLTDGRIHALQCDSKGYIWSISQSGVLEKIDRNRHKVVRRLKVVDGIEQITNYYYKMYIDSDDDIWIYTGNNTDGLTCYSEKTGRTIHFGTQSERYPLNNDLVAGVTEGPGKTIWAATDHGGINIISKKDFTIRYITEDPTCIFPLLHNSLSAIHRDKNGVIWIGTFKSGINYYHQELFQFGLTQHLPTKKEGLPFNDINCFAEDKKGNLWMGTNGFGLIKHNRKTGSYEVYKHDPNNPKSISSDIVVCLTCDQHDNLWIGTYYGGLNRFDGKTFKHYLNDPHNTNSLSDNRIWQIKEDSKGVVWIGSLGGGLMRYQPQSDDFIVWNQQTSIPIHSNFVQAIAEDHKGNLWVGTSNGLEVMEAKSGKFIYYANSDSTDKVLSNNNIISITRDHRNWMWVGTRNGLNCYNAITDSFRFFYPSDGLPDKSILTILEDIKGDLWISTQNGLSRMKISEAESVEAFTTEFENFSTIDGLQGTEFNEYSAIKTRNGELYFGGPNGINRFNPNQINDRTSVPKVLFTQLEVKNKLVGIGDKLFGNIILEKAVAHTQKIKLRYTQNSIALHFTATGAIHPSKLKFRYKLEGFDNEWVETNAGNRIATYTNLSRGKYRLRVQTTSNEENWNCEEARMDITVLAPLYASGSALTLYFLLVITAIFHAHRIITHREKRKYEHEQERIEHQRRHEIDNIKLKFFTNISHEFRTPLTLILTPVERLIAKSSGTEERDQLIMIQRNGKRLLNLVNQLLDFRKLENKEIKLHSDYGDIVSFVRETADSFSDLAENRNIAFRFKSSQKNILTNFDRDKIEKIIFNLLSNAFKFTPANGSIALTIKLFQPFYIDFVDQFNGMSYVEIKVKDNGIGIPPDKLEQIFDRFFQSETSGQLTNQGSGIGLALTQEYVKVHGGTITAESEPEAGSTFIVRLPISELRAEKASETGNEQETKETAEQLSDEQTEQNGAQQIIFLVEDNEELRLYLKENLKKNYTIFDFGDGKSAWAKLKELQPTLVVSDIMMPGLNGLQLCEKIKTNSATSHIPVILLSARAEAEQRLEGLKAGADDYIAKPFNYEILEFKIKKMIDQRKELQNSANHKYEIKPGEINITSLDEKFMQKAIEIVEKNLTDTDFTVEKMSRDLGFSRGHLYNKIMSLTGKTPVEFIRIMRLKRAAQLLEKSQMTVSEVAFQVGFNDPKYFSKYFKAEFKMLPSKYAEQFK